MAHVFKKKDKGGVEEEIAAPVVPASPAGEKLIQPAGSPTGAVVYPPDNPIKE